MENYSIYDEIGRGTHSFVYKARRKRSIEFVAVKSTEKCRMDKILNEVQLLHKLDSRHVLKFYNWYESQNHIWLILEYCIGGDLLNLITQDKNLPEPAVQLFGSELVAGLQYLHSNGILFCDLKPASILIDEFGSLKLADFGLARRIPSKETLANTPQLAPGSPNYMAPELFHQPAVHSFASDFWALGCLLYELCVGRQPFTHTNFSELARMIQTSELELPVAGCAMSPSFWTLLRRLLEKDPYKRITWDELVDHPFWAGLPQLPKVPMPEQELFVAASRTNRRAHEATTSSSSAQPALDAAGPSHHPSHALDASDAHSSQHSSAPTELVDRASHGSSSTTDAVDDDDDNGSSDASEDDDDDDVASLLLLDGAGVAFRPVSAPVKPSAFSTRNASKQRAATNDRSSAVRDTSSAQASADRRQRQPRDGHLTTRNGSNTSSAEPAVPRTAPAPTSSRTAGARRAMRFDGLVDHDGRVGGSGALKKPSKLIFTAADCTVKPIVCSDEIEAVDIAPVRADALRFAPLVAEQLLACATEQLESHLKDVYVSLKASSGAARCNVLAYLFTLCRHAKLANVIVNSSILALLARLLASLTTADCTTTDSSTAAATDAVVAMLCLDLGVLFRFATFIAPSSPEQLQTLVATLTHVARASASVVPRTVSQQLTRRRAAACLGELLFYVSTQPDWRFPVAGLDCVVELLDGGDEDRDDGDLMLRHYAARTLCNVLIHCADALRATLLTERVAQPLADGLVQLCGDDLRQRITDAAGVTALRTTTTQAIAQLLRHLRAPASGKTRAAATPHERAAALKMLTAPPVLHALWRGVTQWQASAELATASLNALNAVLDAKYAPRGGSGDSGGADAGSSAGQAALDANRAALFASGTVSFAPLAAILSTTRSRFQDSAGATNASVSSPNESSAAGDRRRRYSHEASGAPSLLRAKALLFTHLAALASRRFALVCIKQRHVEVVDRMLQPFAAHLRAQSDAQDAQEDNVVTASNSGASTSRTDESSPTRTNTSTKSSRQRVASALSSTDAYVLQCALHVVRASVRLALQLSAECIAAHDNDDVLEDRARSRATVSAAPFALLHALLRHATCRAQLVRYFVATDPRAFAFFVRLMTKLLMTFPTESLRPMKVVVGSSDDLNGSDDGDGLSDGDTTVAVCVSEILLRLLQGSTWDVAALLTAEHELLFTQLLPAVALQLHSGGSTSAAAGMTTANTNDCGDDDLHANCLRVLYVALLHGSDDVDTSDLVNAAGVPHRDAFVKTHVLSGVRAVLSAPSANESVWRFAVELLDGLVARDAELLTEFDVAGLVVPVVALLRAPRQLGLDSLPVSATRLAKRVVDAAMQRSGALDSLFANSGIADALVAGLEFVHTETRAPSLRDLLDVLYTLLLSRYDALRRAKAARSPSPPAPVRFDTLVLCAPVVLRLCAPQQSHSQQQQQSHASRSPQPHESPSKTAPKWRSDQEPSSSQQLDDGNNSCDADIPELASRCLVYLSQIFGDKLNDIVFARAAKQPRGSEDRVARAVLSTLEQNAPDGIVVLRLLLTLKNCIRCQSTGTTSSSSGGGSGGVRVTRWLLEHTKLHQRVKGLAAAGRGASKGTRENASPSSMTREQVAKTASDILRLCQGPSSSTSSSTTGVP